MLSEQEYEQIKNKAWSGTLTGYPSKRWEYAKWFLLKDPMSDFTNYHTGVTMLKHLLYIFAHVNYNVQKYNYFLKHRQFNAKTFLKHRQLYSIFYSNHRHHNGFCKTILKHHLPHLIHNKLEWYVSFFFDSAKLIAFNPSYGILQRSLADDVGSYRVVAEYFARACHILADGEHQYRPAGKGVGVVG